MQKRLSLEPKKQWLLIGSLTAAGMLYFTWCYGLWGRENLLLQYLFQCKCPSHSEPARYPDYVEVVIPACQDASIIVSPQGHLIQVDSKYILDLESGKPIKTPSAGAASFLSDDLLLLDPLESQSNIFSIHNQTIYPVKWLIDRNFPTLENGTFDPNAILPILREAQDVFLIGDFLIAFNVNSKNYKMDRLDLVEPDLIGDTPDDVLTRQFLDENQIPYTLSFQPYYNGELPSLSGDFVMKDDGIYLTSSNQRIVENYQLPTREYSRPKGWYYDDRGVFLQLNGVYLVDWTDYVPSFFSNTRHFWVPQPILLLKVPQEYLSPTSP